MDWTNQINRVTGIALLLLSLGIILSVAFSAPFEDNDPFKRDEVEGFLRDINDNRSLAILATAADIVNDAAIGIVAAAGLYLVFRERNRVLALFGFALIFGGSIAFIAADAAAVPLIVLAEDFAEKGGPGGIAAGDDVILETARAVAIWSFTVDQLAITTIGAGLIAFGALISWTAPATAVNPPRWIGWLAVIAGLATILTWIGAASEDVGIVLFIAGAIATLLFLISLGVWLLMHPEGGARPAPGVV